ncbi:CD226 antigen-like isoform 2-T2 [Clarias gariepinus]
METARTSCSFLLLLVFTCDGFHVLGPSGPLTVQLGGSVMLPCFVETPLPMEEQEVEWKKNDSGSLVHLWQDGESRPESQDQRYHERAHFFTEEIKHGNFSLLLTNVTRDDTGVYKCVVYTNQESDKTLIEIKEIERFIVSGDTNISANIGEDITLTCSVDSHIPAEIIEEISWKKLEDEDILVLLYQEGKVLTDSSHERYKDRVEFFSAEERNKGNFSMKVKNARTEDIGLYICEAFSGELSAKTKVEVVLGFSPMHIAICFLCTLCVFGLLILSFPSFTSLKSNERRPIHWAHVLFPNITMAIAFILWGIDDGFSPEAATCLALNLLRIPCLFWIAPYSTRGRTLFLFAVAN